MKQIEIMYTFFFQVQGMIEFFQCFPAIGFKIPEGMVKIEKRCLYFIPANYELRSRCKKDKLVIRSTLYAGIPIVLQSPSFVSFFVYH